MPVLRRQRLAGENRHARRPLAYETLKRVRPDARQLSAHDHRAAARCPSQKRLHIAGCHCGLLRVGVGPAELCALLLSAAAKQHQFGVWGVRTDHAEPAGGQHIGGDPSMCCRLWRGRGMRVSAWWGEPCRPKGADCYPSSAPVMVLFPSTSPDDLHRARVVASGAEVLGTRRPPRQALMSRPWPPRRNPYAP